MNYGFFIAQNLNFQKVGDIYIKRNKNLNLYTMKLLTSAIIAVLLGLAISLSIKNHLLQSELERATENEIRNEWINTAKEAAAIENNDSILVVGYGNE